MDPITGPEGKTNIVGDLPGKLYLWAVEHLFVKNEMFKGELKVAGKTVNLRSITCPVFLLGGEEDDTTPWQQVHNMPYAVGSLLVRWYLAPGGHIGLFISTGRRLSTGRGSWLRSANSHDHGYHKMQPPALQPEVLVMHQGKRTENQMPKAFKPYNLIKCSRKPWLTDEENAARIMTGLKKSAWT